ncbi:hypothetical protein H376_9570 [Rickettsia prowazekii str. GvF12]|nr:hypothetical protein H376_9570 [Rickettsia prowazekii str. GvF12]
MNIGYSAIGRWKGKKKRRTRKSKNLIVFLVVAKILEFYIAVRN